MPPAGDGSDESFRGLVLQLRGRIGLTQRQLAERLGVHVHTVQAWEAGVSYPGAASLQGLIAAGLDAGGFATGHELAEAQALWAAAVREAPRLRTPFDRAWFDGLLRTAGPAAGRGPATDAGPAHSARASPGGPRRQHWGEAPDVVGFLGRAAERELLRRWVLDDRCRVVAVLGLGGIGKTLLTARLAHDLAPAFERVYWRSLRDAPPPGEWLAGAIGFLAPNEVTASGGDAARLGQLLELIHDRRCLLVLDNFETVLKPGERIGGYRPGYEGYGRLLQQLAESPHQSCLLQTSREEPPEVGPLRGDQSPVQVLALAGLGVEDGQALLRDKRLEGDAAAWQALVERYGGNGLALKVIGESIRELFGGAIAAYLKYVATTDGILFGGVGRLLEAQIQRLSSVEQDLLRQLAVEREPVALAELAADLGSSVGRGAVLEAVEGLRRRSLLERSERGVTFTLQSVVLEYVTERLVDEIARELATGELDCLLGQPLLKATARDYVRRSQERLLVTPLLDRLIATRGSRPATEQRLVDLLDQLRGRPLEARGYGPGNLVNLLRLLRGDLRGVDLSGLAIRQAYLQEAEAQDASLAGAHLVEVVLAEAFNYPTCTALSADGAYLAAGTSTGEVCLWRVADRALLATLRGHAGLLLGVALSGDGQLVASGSHDGTVKLWEAASGRTLATLQGHTGATLGVALSQDGRLAASGSYDGTVKLWEAPSGRLLATLQAHAGGALGVALSGDGRLAASGSEDAPVRLWETENGRLLATVQGHSGSVPGAALSADGRLAASGSVDGTVRLWDVASGACQLALRGDRRYERLIITGLTGVTEAQRGALLALGAVERAGPRPSEPPAAARSDRPRRGRRVALSARLGDAERPESPSQTQ